MIDLPPFASARSLIRDAVQDLEPPSRETVDEYAAGHRYVPRRSGSGFTIWDHETAPYLVEPMRCMTSYQYLTTAIVGPGQSGKTSVAENAMLHAVEKSPRDILWYMQTEKALEAYVKKRVNPMIKAHEEMSKRIGGATEDSTLHFKQFDRMTVEFLSATYANLISKSAPIIIADEIDAWLETLGDPKPLLDVRRQTYGHNSMLLAVSHPDRATGLDPIKDWRGGIMRIYADSDRRVWYWPCPFCGGWSSPVPIAKRVMTVEWPRDGTLDEIEANAHLKCPLCEAKIADRYRKQMNLAAYHSDFGGWIGRGQDISEDGTVTGDLIRSDTAGFYFVGPMSPFLLKGLGGLARELVKAERDFEVSGDDKTVKEVTVKQFGYLYSSKGPVGSVDAETLAERSLNEPQPLGIVPEGVRFLTAWLDIQIAHFEVLVRGWGVDGESWIVDKMRVSADTATDGEAWELLLTELSEKLYPLASDPSRGMIIRAIGYDSGGAPGTTDQANKAWKVLRSKKLIHLYGMMDGRDVWSMLPTKGASSPTAPRLSVVYPDNARKDRKVKTSGTVPLARFNANQYKDNLSGHLKQGEPGPLYVHFPAALRSKEPPHVTFEQLVSEKRDALGHWSKPHQGIRNEMLDLMVGNHVLAWLHGLGRIKWDRPPIWAAEWDKNSMIHSFAERISEKMEAATSAASSKPRRTIGGIMKS